jgi:hypothetical protein
MHGALALYFAAAALFGDETLCRAGSALLAAGLAYALYRFLQDGGFSALPPEAAAADCLGFYREQLARRSRAAKGYRWSVVLPTFPGAVLGTVGWIVANPLDWILPIGIFGFFAGFQYVACMHQEQIGDKIDKEIALLDGQEATAPRSHMS